MRSVDVSWLSPRFSRGVIAVHRRPWGSMADSKSRLHQLALRIEREQIRVQYPDIPAWAWRVARSASRYAACAEMMLGSGWVRSERHAQEGLSAGAGC
jgi:hypothetical protein